jgi:hypothetical protein
MEATAEALEEIGLTNAIRQGRRDEFVSEKQIAAILAKRRECGLEEQHNATSKANSRRRVCC